MATALSTLAMSTGTLFCSMGVMTMKMISSTSITSTIGVTLMLEFTLLAYVTYCNSHFWGSVRLRFSNGP